MAGGGAKDCQRGTTSLRDPCDPSHESRSAHRMGEPCSSAAAGGLACRYIYVGPITTVPPLLLLTITTNYIIRMMNQPSSHVPSRSMDSRQAHSVPARGHPWCAGSLGFGVGRDTICDGRLDRLERFRGTDRMAGATTATATSRRIREHLREDLREERDGKRRERAQIGP